MSAIQVLQGQGSRAVEYPHHHHGGAEKRENEDSGRVTPLFPSPGFQQNGIPGPTVRWGALKMGAQVWGQWGSLS